MLRGLAVAAASLALTACASAPHYETTQMGPELISIETRLAGTPSENMRARMREEVLVRAAEEARDRGYCYFLVSRSADGQRFLSRTTPSLSQQGGATTVVTMQFSRLTTVVLLRERRAGDEPNYAVAEIIRGDLGRRYSSAESRARPIDCEPSPPT